MLLTLLLLIPTRKADGDDHDIIAATAALLRLPCMYGCCRRLGVHRQVLAVPSRGGGGDGGWQKVAYFADPG